jgi:hypothetical protein
VGVLKAYGKVASAFSNLYISLRLRREDASLRGNGKTVGGIEDRLSSAQDRLSEVDGSCSLAPSHTIRQAYG